MSEIFDYLDKNFEVYINAASEEREKIRLFVKEKRFDIPQRNVTYYMAYLLLMYVKERIMPSLKPAKKLSIIDKLKRASESPEDKAQLLRGLVAISMENLSEKFYDKSYTGEYPYGDAMYLLADLYVTSEERGMNPENYFRQIANISSDKGILPMNQMMASGGESRLRSERSQFGEFKGMF